MTALWIAAFALVSAMIAHVTALRLGMGALAAYGASLLAGGVVLTASLLLLPQRMDGGSALSAALLFCAWWFIFLNLVQSFESSLRVNVLRQLLRDRGSLDHAAFFARYNDRSLIELRLARLMRGGTVVMRDGRLFVVSTPARLMANLFRGLKLLVLGRPSEFDRLGR